LLKKADKIALQEKVSGEEYLPDENKVYKPLPIDGVIKPGPLSRLFGGVCHALSVAAISLAVLAVLIVLIKETPIYAFIKAHEGGGLESIWSLMKDYAIDVVLMTIAGAIVIKGYKDGILNGINTVGISLIKVIAIVGAMYLPLSIWTAEGGAFEYLTIGAMNLAAKFTIPLLPVSAKVLIVKLGFGIVLAILAWIAVKLIGMGLNKVLDYVDDNPALWRIDGFIGAIMYAVIMIAVIAVILVLMYSIEFFGTFPMSNLFTENSTITGGAFDVCDITLKPVLEQIKMIFTVKPTA
jgi:hypothetical protein